ncbi:hypothetical protein RclHR1_03870003 [Rhizophagus clarus]|uniref:Uncharacterized protein n=1 Tax=Rhizophagus clarus TaxID=94130 RepID=A0A2Z6RHA2_9GLOM|nr:hypothetical protein RclHR1_03870003 [Rhizophagus clarus]
MSRKTKRQQQVSKILRKKRCYISKNKTETEIKTIENEEWVDNEVIRDQIEGEEDEDINNWTEKDLNEFEKVGKRLITKVLHWQENTANSIRAVYNRTSKITAWRKKKKKEEFEHEAKGMRTLDTLFVSVKASTSKPLPESLQSLQTQFLFLQNPSIVTEEITRNLQECLNKINQQYSITKLTETNKNIYTYDYLRCLSI